MRALMTAVIVQLFATTGVLAHVFRVFAPATITDVDVELMAAWAAWFALLMCTTAVLVAGIRIALDTWLPRKSAGQA